MLFSQLFFCLLTVFGFPFGWSYKLASFLKKKPYLTIVIFIQLRHTFTVSQTFSSLCKKNPTKKQLKQKRQKTFLQIFLLLFLLVSMIFDKISKGC